MQPQIQICNSGFLGAKPVNIGIGKMRMMGIKPVALVSDSSGAGRRSIGHKRRTVLWLFNEDYEYLSGISKSDADSKNVSMHRLVKALRAAGIKSFLNLDERLNRLEPREK